MSSVSSLVEKAVTSFTNVDSDAPDNGAVIKLFLAGQEQLPTSCVRYLSNP